MPDLVLEVGTEEMPAGAIESALEQLRAAVEKGLADLRLGAGSVEVCGTPRRLIVRAAGVPARQPDQEREVRGPARSVAFDASGKPTGAAIGFARKQGVSVEELATVSTPQGEYVLARVTDEGQPAAKVLGGMLSDAVRGLYFPKMMRWGRETTRFVRPVRWVFALLDQDVVPMELFGVVSGRTSRGHRFLAPQPFEAPSANDLFPRLRASYVMVDPSERRNIIREQANQLATEAGGSIPWDEGLLDENNWLVEWPTALLGRFDEKYLELPRPVLVTAMKKHQRFFPVQDAEGKLLARFIAVRNGGAQHLNVVTDGDERVLTARFADAAFFYSQDRETPLTAMAEKLGRLVFQEKLGTMAQKRERLVALVGSITDALGLGADEKELAQRAASLAKADLVSQMVVELPSLQGVMGREYALAHGEDASVADAIVEHYLPRSASDALPASDLGKLLAVADRIDTLVGYVGLGILPSGSSDPYGLRRAAQGVVQILSGEPRALPLDALYAYAAAAYRSVNGLDFALNQLAADLRGLFNQRIAATLEERGVRYDLIDATLEGGPIEETVFGTVSRGEALQALSNDAQWVPTVQAGARVANILRSVEPSEAAPNPERFTEEAERRLHEAAQQLAPEAARLSAAADYAGLYRALDALRDPVNGFFDDVLVMAEDEAVRANRLALVSEVNRLYRALADFTRVVVA